MRRFMLIVAALVFASPVMAVTIDAVKVGSDVAITYTGGTGVRAFALDVTVDNDATITGVSGFYSGEGAGYGIFPGNFRDIIVPTAPNWAEPNYTPVAPAGDRVQPVRWAKALSPSSLVRSMMVMVTSRM